MMTGYEKWWQSRTIWYAIVAALAAVLRLFGVEIGTETQADILTAVMGIVGAVGAIVYRIKADKIID